MENDKTALPLVSVIVPCYGQAHWLSNALDSVLNGHYPAVEIIVIDDGSPDNTAQIAMQYVEREPQRVRLIRQPNAGVSAARNAALLQTRGEWIQLLDADDALHPDALRLKIEAAQRDPDAAVVGGSWQEVDAAGQVIPRPGFLPVIEALPLPHDSRDVLLALFDPLMMGPPVRYLFRREVLHKVGLFEPRLHPCEDWDFFLRTASHGYAFARAPESVAYYRNHQGSASKHWERMWLAGLLANRRTAQLHPRDPQVQRAARDGVRRWRYYCHVTLLAPALAELRKSGHKREALQVALAALRRDFRLLPLLLGTFKGYVMGRATVVPWEIAWTGIGHPAPSPAVKPKPR